MNYNLIKYNYSLLTEDIEKILFYRSIFLKYYTSADENQEQLKEIFEWFNNLDLIELHDIGIHIYQEGPRKHELRLLLDGYTPLVMVRVVKDENTVYRIWAI